MSALAKLPLTADHERQRAALAVAMVVACLALPLVAFERTTAEMISIWSRSETYSHCFAVVPIVLWLVWQRRLILATLSVTPWLPGVVLLAFTGAFWLVADLAEANAPAQFALVAMVPLLIATVLGLRWVRALAFPLAFLLFAVPFGEAIVPWLMDRTADFTVAALKVSGIPVFREGNRFVIPTGAWSVVEACSGIRYLIASLMLGTLYAYLMYRSLWRRVAFIAASALVPILANWVRAYLIVMIGHLTNNRFAVGVDHLIYGWLFFGLVITLMFWVGARWREREELPIAAAHPAAPQPRRAALIGVLGAAAALLPWSLAADAVHARVLPSSAAISFAPVDAQGGWRATDVRVADWQPHLVRPTLASTRFFTDGTHVVGVALGLYERQSAGAELVTASNQFVPSDSRWVIVARGSVDTEVGGRPLRAVTATLREPRATLIAWRWYWWPTGASSSDIAAKWHLVLARLRGDPEAAAWVSIFTVAERAQDAAPVLHRFARDMGPSVHRSLQATIGANP